MKVLVRLIHWIWTLLWALWPWGRRRRTAFPGLAPLDPSVDPASEIAAGKIVIIGSGGKLKWLRFGCPCGCGDVIALSLMKSHYPHWRAEVHGDGTLTVYPSVDAEKCGSHFWIKRNEIDWV